MFPRIGGTKDCDHWHQGAGFVTSHMSLTLMFEKSLQAVNPAVAVPYWDFTLESTFFGASDFRTSGVFADDWFGAASPKNVRRAESGRVEGRGCGGWAGSFVSLLESCMIWYGEAAC